ncbi:MAG TPA: DUF3943 domain-containing protein [Flavisolibacter sp.]|nr:DUF3943 domain-containing protein [Flavisolibacter sp.]
MAFLPALVQAQDQPGDSAVKADRIGTETVSEKHPFRSLATWLAVQALPWSYNRWIRQAEFARVRWHSIRHNLNPRNWEWDDNTFATNQFAHPYHGNLYFNAFRTNGYDFLRSALPTLGGSLLWELAGETHAPAPNDLLNTTLGGISLGEITYRLSQRLVATRQTGFKRQVREVAALLINPLNGWNRIVTRKWGKGGVDEKPAAPFFLELEYGKRRYSQRVSDVVSKGRNETFGRVFMEYGKEDVASRIPFNHFTATLEMGNSDSAFLNLAKVNASLFSWQSSSSDKRTDVYTVSLNYDYYKNTAFSYGAQSIHLNRAIRYRKKEREVGALHLNCGWTVLAAVPDAYLYYGEGRNYDYGTGVEAGVKGKWNLSNAISYEFGYSGGWLTTINGSRSNYALYDIRSSLRYQIRSGLYGCLEWGDYLLRGHYAGQPTINREYPYIRLTAGYRLAL